MNRMMIVVVVLMAGTQAFAATKLKGGRFQHGQRYDPSLDFSKHFDDEIRAQPAGEPEAPRPARNHRTRPKSSRRPRAAAW